MRFDDPLWYKDALIYQLHVKVFSDSNNDGVGDFKGLTDKLDYIADLGVTAIWLMPFYPSPLRDDGYDISEYQAVHPDYGSLRDFRRFVREAHRRNLKVITELVINHTSDQHPWFIAARNAPKGSAKRNMYVWSDSDKQYPETRIIFTDTESSNWAWDPVAGQYYWHRFFSHQPDLNHNNPAVVRAVMRVMRFWLDAGVDGLRLDAIPYLCVRENSNNENLPETHTVLKQMRAELNASYPDRVFLAEANQWPEDVLPYFGEGDECHMAFHFPLMPRIYMALAQEDRHPITEIMHQTPEIPDSCQWAIFLRNHDELTLEMVTDRERDYMYQAYAADPRMRVNLGIRRRLASLLENDRERIKLLNSLLLSMPGTPILYYGDEIGMGDNIYLGDRNGVRTPMQWSSDRNAGFSRADPARLYLPPIMDPIYGYQAVNVEAEMASGSSLLHWMKRLIAVRRAHRAFGRGTLEFLRPGNRKILAYLREYEDDSILCVANLSRAAQPVELNLARFKERVPIEMMGKSHFPPIGELPYLLTLPGHSFYWFLLAKEAEVPSWHEDFPLPPPELSVLVLPQGLHSLFNDKPLRQLEREALVPFLSARRWFAGSSSEQSRVSVSFQARWKTPAGSFLLAFLETRDANQQPKRYFTPWDLAFEEGSEDVLQTHLHWTVAKVRRKAQTGVLYDALESDAFCRAMVDAMGVGDQIEADGHTLTFFATQAYAELTEPQKREVRRVGVEQTNTSVILDDQLVLKVYRRLQEGMNPDLEMGHYLTEVARFPHTPPLYGALQAADPQGEVTTLALLQGFVKNQGDGWSFTEGYLSRYFEDSLSSTGEEEEDSEPHGMYLSLMETLGRRTGELHKALALPCTDPLFAPQEVTEAEVRDWVETVKKELSQTLLMLDKRRDELPGAAAELADKLQKMDTRPFFKALNLSKPTLKTRYHGDYHLGQVLVAQNDFYIIDFEGEPERPLQKRREKHSPLRDVAGMLRSLNYAAYAALARATEEAPEDLQRLQGRAAAFEFDSRQAFLLGYTRGRTQQEAPLNETERGLINLFCLEKAAYEVRYELSYRLDWLALPLAGLLELLDKSQKDFIQ